MHDRLSPPEAPAYRGNAVGGRYHTGAMSGMREVPYRTMLDRKPDYIIWHAVKGMMPKTRLTEAQMKKLRIYAGDKHDMQAQAPIPANI